VTAGAGMFTPEPDATGEPPPHDPAYQFSVVPDPPLAESRIVPASPGQICERSTEADAGAVLSLSTETVMLAHAELPQEVSHRAKYVVVAVGEAMDTPLPVAMVLDAQESANQRSVVPDPPVAVRTMFPASLAQKLLRSVLTEVGVTGLGFTVTPTLAHPVLDTLSLVRRALAK